MKISQALSRFILLIHTLANTSTTLATPTYVPPVPDGYVDPRSIKPRLLQVNRTDLALAERGVDDNNDIKSRQIGAVIFLVLIAVELVRTIARDIITQIQDENPRREAYTQGVIRGLYSKNPYLSYVVCHSAYDVLLDGTEGNDWGHFHHELDISFGRTIGYDVYMFRSGTFGRYGDGGYINWAYTGDVFSRSYGSPDVVVFGSAPSGF